MKKSLLILGVLAVGFANAQQEFEGKVGVNTETPKATLEIQPSVTNLAGTTNEGIIAPKLSKTRIATITAPVEGTLVYATDAVYAGTNTKVAKIDEKGYYYFDGTEWVKAKNVAQDQEWVYDPATKRINLKRSGQDTQFINSVFYNSSTGQFVNADKMLLINHNNVSQGNGVSNILLKKSSNILPDNGSKTLASSVLKVDEPNTIQGNFKINAHHATVELIGTNKAPSYWVVGGSSSIFKNDDNETQFLSGASNNVIINKGTVAGYATANRSETYINSPNNINETRGISSFLTAAENSRNINEMIGINSFVRLGSNDVTINNKVVGFSTLMDYTFFNPNVQDLIGFHYQGVQQTTSMSNTVNHYGILLEDVTKAQNNYAIYTKSGQVRVGDLKGTGNRNVYADADGVLKVGDAVATGATQLSGTDGIECNEANRGKMNFKRDVDLGGGKTADAMGVCLKGSDGGYHWNYMYGNGGKTTGSNTFGAGLQ